MKNSNSNQGQAPTSKSSRESVDSDGSSGRSPGGQKSCGWGGFQPACLQPFARVWTFIIFYIVYSFTHGVQGSYTISVLTTLEKRFNLPSYLAGSLVTISTFGYMISVIFVSFFFAKRHPPRLFAICMLLTSLCALLYVIPHFIYGTGNDSIDSSYAEHTDSKRSIFHDNSSVVTERETEKVQLCQEFQNETSWSNISSGNVCTAKQKATADEEVKFIKPAMVLFALSEILQGVAGAPIWTVGLAYVDDHTNKELSAKLIGIMFAVRFVSPIVSFGMGGLLLSVYASLKETGLTPEHPRWIGAWWMGYLVCSVINIIICIPTSMIPKNLKPMKKSSAKLQSPFAAKDTKGNNNEQNEKKDGVDGGEEEKEAEEVEKEDDDDDEEDEGVKEEEELVVGVGGENNFKKSRNSVNMVPSQWKDLPKATMRLISNPIYMLLTITACIDCFVIGFMTFLPKYVEIQFQQTAWVASLLGGMTPAIFGGFGSYLGGIISGKIKGADGGVAGNCKMTFLMSLLSLCILVPAMLLSCPNVIYNGEVIHDRLNVTTTCNWKCDCPSGGFDPVCGSDGLLYFSPCHAGCTEMANKTHTNAFGQQVRATGCQCVSSGDSSSLESLEGERVVFSGFCDDSCVSLIPYVLCAVAIFVSINLYNVPFTNITFRCTREEDKSFALGLQIFAICVAVFPAPAMYGSIFDSNCILKETTSCTDSEGACLLYDKNALRLTFHGLAIGIRVLSTSLYLVTYVIARRRLAALRKDQKLEINGQTTLIDHNGQLVKETVL